MFSVLFPGQGSQSVGMAKNLYENFNYIKSLFEQADDILKNSLSKMILEGPKELLDQTKNTQPAIFLVSYSIFKVIKNETSFQIKSNNNVDYDSIINEVKCENIETTETYSKFDIKEYKNINIENLNISIFQNLTKINEKLVIQNNDKKYIVILCDINYNEKAAKDNIKDN